jgi:hypothetical protein
MSDRDNVESAFLKARAKFMAWVDEVNVEWNKGNTDAALGVLETKLNQLPPAIKAKSQQANPDAWAAIQNRKKGGSANG